MPHLIDTPPCCKIGLHARQLRLEPAASAHGSGWLCGSRRLRCTGEGGSDEPGDGSEGEDEASRRRQLIISAVRLKSCKLHNERKRSEWPTTRTAVSAAQSGEAGSPRLCKFGFVVSSRQSPSKRARGVAHRASTHRRLDTLAEMGKSKEKGSASSDKKAARKVNPFGAPAPASSFTEPEAYQWSHTPHNERCVLQAPSSEHSLLCSLCLTIRFLSNPQLAQVAAEQALLQKKAIKEAYAALPQAFQDLAPFSEYKKLGVTLVRRSLALPSTPPARASSALPDPNSSRHPFTRSPAPAPR